MSREWRICDAFLATLDKLYITDANTETDDLVELMCH